MVLITLFSQSLALFIMALSFDSTHEYYMGDDAHLHYCTDHETLIIVKDYEDRLLINGIDKATMLEFASKFYKDSLKNELSKDKDAAQDKDVLINLPEGTNLTKQAVSDRAK